MARQRRIREAPGKATCRRKLDASSTSGQIRELLTTDLSIVDIASRRPWSTASASATRSGSTSPLEAIREYLRRPQRNLDRLLHYATIDRVAKAIRPYLEAMV